jgi:hypothetical protein
MVGNLTLGKHPEKPEVNPTRTGVLQQLCSAHRWARKLVRISNPEGETPDVPGERLFSFHGNWSRHLCADGVK